MHRRSVLLNPGPVTLSERVRSALTRGDWCHREAEFATLTREINQRLARVYPQMAEGFEAVTITGSGSAAVEGMLHAFAPVDGATLVVSNGVYGERMVAMLAAQGKAHWTTQGDWLSSIDIRQVEALLTAHPQITHVATVQHETTTGRLNDLDTLGRLCKTRGLSLLVDAVSSFGAENIEPEAWNLAALASTANKCLHGVPGLSFVLARASCWSADSPATSVYLDLHRYHRAQHGDGFSPFTQAVQVAFALSEALAELEDEGGWRERQRSYSRRAEVFADTLHTAGVEPLLPSGTCSAVLRAWKLPSHLGYEQLHDRLKSQGIVIYAGQGNLQEQVFRIAHMGDIDGELDHVKRVLSECLRAP